VKNKTVKILLSAGILLVGVLLYSASGKGNFLGTTDGDIREMASMLTGDNTGLSRPVSLRDFWKKYPVPASIFQEADKLAGLPMPDGKSFWKEFSHRIAVWTIAEASENKGKYISCLSECLARWCKQVPWQEGFSRMPQHLRGNPDVANIDLLSCRKIRDISESYWILSEKLPEKTKQLIRQSMEKWCFSPMRQAIAQDDLKKVIGAIYLGDLNNWNSFCNAGVLNAVTVFLPKKERAVMLANIRASLFRYVSGFDDDGYIPEGAGYYSMGVSRLLDCQETFMNITKGKCDIFASCRQKMSNILAYPVTFSMDGNILYPPFADSGVDGQPQNEIPGYFRAQLDLHTGKATNRRFWDKGWDCAHGLFLAEDIVRTLRLLKIRESTLNEDPDPVPPKSFFRSSQVLILRSSSGFSLAAKGGYNFEPHNHNDLGSFCLGKNGRIILGDPGLPAYTPDYFSSAKSRYANQFASSWGHPVPVPAGKLQSPGGRSHGARILEYSPSEKKTVFKLDLKSGYPDAKTLKKLTRTFCYQRDPVRLTVSDEFEFSQPELFAAALVSYDEMRISGEKIETDDLEILFSAGEKHNFQFTKTVFTSKARGQKKPVRIGYELTKPVLKGEITVTIIPKK